MLIRERTAARMDLHNLPDGMTIEDLEALKKRATWRSENGEPISTFEILQLIELAKSYAWLKRVIEQDYTWQDVKLIQPRHNGIVIVMLEQGVRGKMVTEAWFSPLYKEWHIFDAERDGFYPQSKNSPIIYWSEYPLCPKSLYLLYKAGYNGQSGGNKESAQGG